MRLIELLYEITVDDNGKSHSVDAGGARPICKGKILLTLKKQTS